MVVDGYTAGLPTAARVATDVRDAVVASIADAVINAPDTVTLRAPALVAEPSILRRRAGESVFVGCCRCTYPETSWCSGST